MVSIHHELGGVGWRHRSGPSSWRQPNESELRRVGRPMMVIERSCWVLLARGHPSCRCQRASSSYAPLAQTPRRILGASHFKSGQRRCTVVFVVALVMVSSGRPGARSIGSVALGVVAPSRPSYELVGKMGGHAAQRQPRSSGRGGRDRAHPPRGSARGVSSTGVLAPQATPTAAVAQRVVARRPVGSACVALSWRSAVGA